MAIIKTGTPDDKDPLSAPLGDLIASVGQGIAKAQAALDDQTMARFKEIFDSGDDRAAEMRRMGFTPTWYRIPEAEADITVSLSVGMSSDFNAETAGEPVSGGDKLQLYASPVDASYANKYDFRFEAVSRLKFKVVAVPPSAEAEAARVVPKGLVGMQYEAAVETLTDWDIPNFWSGKESHPDGRVVVSVVPPEGTVLRPGDRVELKLKTG